jgi:hypothetical protein
VGPAPPGTGDDGATLARTGAVGAASIAGAGALVASADVAAASAATAARTSETDFIVSKVAITQIVIGSRRCSPKRSFIAISP